jgi:parallel beta-helix repeat protein
VTNSTISNVNAPGSSGYGIYSYNGSGNLFTGLTATGRSRGVYLSYESNTTVSGCTLTDSSTYGIEAYGQENVFVDNDVSRSSLMGIKGTGADLVVRGNVSVDSGYGVFLIGPSDGSIIAANTLTGSAPNAGLYLRDHTSVEVKENTITGGSSDGVVLLNSPAARVYHNNIYSNAGYQVTSDVPIEVSYGNEGNFWGRVCETQDSELFVPLVDSNAYDVADSNPYGSADAWKNELDPGCGPPPAGWIVGEVWDDVSPVTGVTMTLEDSGGTPLIETYTDGFGDYSFVDLEPGIYNVSMIVPIGYAPVSPTQQEAIVDPDAGTQVDFDLERLVAAADTRSKGYWKHQAKVHVKGRGNAHETAEALLDYLADIQYQYDVFDDVVGLEGILAVLEPPKPATMSERAEEHLMAMMMNLASLRIATYTEVSEDDTCGEAIDHIIGVLGEAGSAKAELEAAKDLAEDINNGLTPLDPERIPEPEEPL